MKKQRIIGQWRQRKQNVVSWWKSAVGCSLTRVKLLDETTVSLDNKLNCVLIVCISLCLYLFIYNVCVTEKVMQWNECPQKRKSAFMEFFMGVYLFCMRTHVCTEAQECSSLYFLKEQSNADCMISINKRQVTYAANRFCLCRPSGYEMFFGNLKHPMLYFCKKCTVYQCMCVWNVDWIHKHLQFNDWGAYIHSSFWSLLTQLLHVFRFVYVHACAVQSVWDQPTVSLIKSQLSLFINQNPMLARTVCTHTLAGPTQARRSS